MKKEELAEVYGDWKEELDRLRKPSHTKLSDLSQEERHKITKYVEMARTDTGTGIVPFRELSKQIKKRFGYKFGNSTISDWCR